MFPRRSAKRRRAPASGPAELLPGCLARTADAVTRVTGARPPAADLDAGAALCAGLALDDRLVTDRAPALTVPIVLHALQGETVHFLAPTAHRAAGFAAWLEPVAEVLGLRVGLLDAGDDHETRARRYDAQVVCGTASEFAYDELRNWLSWSAADRVASRSRVAVVDEIDTVLLDQGPWIPRIAGPVPVGHDWHQWAEAIAPQLERGHHVEVAAGKAVLTPPGVEHLLERIDLRAAYRDHVPVFSLVTAAVIAREFWRRGRDYQVSGDEVRPTGPAFPAGVREALTVHEGLSLTTADVVLAATTVRGHLLAYEFVAGIGVLPGDAERQLRELYGLRVRTVRGGAPAGRELLFEDDESRMAAMRMAAGANGRPVLYAAATRDLVAAVRGFAGDGTVLGPDDPIGEDRHAMLLAAGRPRHQWREIRLARAADDARFYLTAAELKATPSEEYRYEDEFARVQADVREAQREQLDSARGRLTGEDALGGFEDVMGEHLDWLAAHYRRGELDYPELLGALGELYPCGLPGSPPPDVAVAVRADARRAFVQRCAELAAEVGADGTKQLAGQVALSVAHKWWREHLADLDTLAVVCRIVRPRRRGTEFSTRAAELFSASWPEFIEQTMRHFFHVEVRRER